MKAATNSSPGLSKELLELALKASHTGVWAWDVGSNKLHWSAQTRRIFGLASRAAVTHERYKRLIYPDDRPQLDGQVERVLTKGGSYTLEHQVVWPDKSVHWVRQHGQARREAGRVVGLFGTAHSLDEQKGLEQALEQSEERFRVMADTAPVLIWMSGDDKGCTYFNKRWLEFTGRSLADQLGKGWEKSVHPADLPRCRAVYDAAYDSLKPYAMEYRLRRYDGEYRWVQDSGAPLFSGSGQFQGFIGSCFDIQDIKNSDARKVELEEINAKLEKQRRQLIALNRSKDEFISLASHQLRTPATGVKQYIGMMLEGFGGELSADQVHLLRVAYESNERQLAVIDDLLKVAQVDADKVVLKKERTDLVPLVGDIVREMSNKFKAKRQTVNIDCKARRMTVWLDQQKFRMALENIIDNANKYTPDGKTVTIRLFRRGRQVRISVIDQGVGIAKKDLDKLFQKFSRVNNSLTEVVGGSGLGLYWAKRIIVMHGGSIEVKSRLNRGSEFAITLRRV